MHAYIQSSPEREDGTRPRRRSLGPPRREPTPTHKKKFDQYSPGEGRPNTGEISVGRQHSDSDYVMDSYVIGQKVVLCESESGMEGLDLSLNNEPLLSESESMSLRRNSPGMLVLCLYVHIVYARLRVVTQCMRPCIHTCVQHIHEYMHTYRSKQQCVNYEIHALQYIHTCIHTCIHTQINTYRPKQQCFHYDIHALQSSSSSSSHGQKIRECVRVRVCLHTHTHVCVRVCM